MLIFISGGVRSGKSTFAEEIVDKHPNKVYLATARVTDPEMLDRINSHQARRVGYKTIEAPKITVNVLNDIKKGDVVLLDCLTNWLSNEMFNDGVELEVSSRMMKIIDEMKIKAKHLIIVSNDVFSGTSNYDDLTMRYLQNLGDLHQEIVSKSDEVYELYAGIKMRKK